MKPITARRRGRCCGCHVPINEGDAIMWERGIGSWHTECAPDVAPTEPVALPASAAQQKLLTRLYAERVTAYQPDVTVLVSREASRLIDELMAAPKRPVAPSNNTIPSPEQVPAGRYALEANGVALIHVWRGRNPYVVRVYDYDTGERLDTKSLLARLMAEGVAHCALRFGQLRKRCYRCDQKLSNRLSVELSVGPECGRHLFADEVWKDMKGVARATIRARGEDPYETVVSDEDTLRHVA